MSLITNATLTELKNVSQPKIWQQEVFFIENQINEAENRYDAVIYSIHQETRQKRQWTADHSYSTQLEISPDGKYLSYLMKADDLDGLQLFVMPLAGGVAQQLTNEKKGVTFYQWQTNGQALYYQTLIDIETDKDEKTDTDKKEVPQPYQFDKLYYRSDGRGLLPQDVCYQVKGLYLEDKREEVLFEQEEPFGLAWVNHKGERLIYTQKANEDELTYGTAVFQYDVLNQKSKQLTISNPTGAYSFAAANPNEDYYLFLGNDLAYGFVTLNRLYVYDVKNETMSCITDAIDADIVDMLVADFQQNVNGFPVTWLDNGRFIFPATWQGRIQVYQGDISGKIKLVFNDPCHLTDGAVDIQTGQLAVTYSTLDEPSRLAMLDLSQGHLQDLYNPNPSFKETYQLAEIEEISYPGYNEEWDIQAWYLPPVYEVKANQPSRHPAILYIHGGPQVAYGYSFFHEMQALAAKGYGVIMLNPRGGNGYGQAFVASILGAYGQHDFDDIMLGLDKVLSLHSEIDQDRLYLAGGSYGGFMTNWIVTHSKRFKAAVTQRCISNWISFYGTSDIGPNFVEFQLKHDIYEADKLWQMSPLAHIKNAQTPLLILHGQEDYRCPQEQAEQMYTAMKKQGVETKLIIFPQSSHGLSRQGLPNLRQARLEAIQDWFESH